MKADSVATDDHFTIYRCATILKVLLEVLENNNMYLNNLGLFGFGFCFCY